MEINCEYCAKPFKAKWKNNKFCNLSCAARIKYSVAIKNWLENKQYIINTYFTPKWIRRYLREKYNDSCSSCGWNKINKVTNTIPLEVNHIDGNHTNYNPTNLEILCPNCHSLTQNYKGLNRGKGRGIKVVQRRVSSDGRAPHL